MATPDRMPPLTVVVLRGLHSAMAHMRANVESSEVGDFTSSQLDELQRAADWLTAATSRAGIERVYPHLKASRLGKVRVR